MYFKKFSLGAALAGLVVLAGCNIFNPNGAEQSSCPSDNADCYIALGLSLSQKGNFDGSMSAYEKAIAIDSTKSEAYWGYATSAKFKFNLTLPELLGDIENATAKDTVKDSNDVVVLDSTTGSPTIRTRGVSAFMRLNNVELQQRVNLGVNIARVLGRLSDRDSLTQWYAYLSDSTNKNSDPHFAARKAFITAYLTTNASNPSRNGSKFPLTDGKKTYSDAKPQYMPYLLYSATLGNCDLGSDGIFVDSDRDFCDALFGDPDGPQGFGDIAEKMKNDTVFQQNVNNKILDIQNGVGDLSTLISQFAPGQSVDTTGGAPGQTQSNIDSIVTSLGQTMVFYQFGDRLDNDGDGCIDEEFVDSVDNDLDGFVDEDARLINGNGTNIGAPQVIGPGDGIDNDHNGKMDGDDNPGEARFLFPTVKTLTFVVLYTDPANFVKIKKDAANMNVRIGVQHDSLSLPGRSALPGYADKLQHAKDAVGGCWRNY